MFIDDLKNDYLSYVKLFKSEGTYKFYEFHLNSILDYFNVNNVKKIKRKDILNYIDDMQKNGLSNKTINNRILSLKTMLKHANIKNHDIFSIPKLKSIDHRYMNLTNNEVNILVQYILTSNIKIINKLVIALFLETGIRLNELINIETKNINLENRSILLETSKNKEVRIVFYSDLTDRYIRQVDLTTKFLVNMTKKGVYSIFERVRLKLGFKKFHPHMLRHTYATILVQNNTNLEFVRLTMGHKSLRTTQRYLHFNVDVMKKIYDNSFKF